jgi:hypothetical protein
LVNVRFSSVTLPFWTKKMRVAPLPLMVTPRPMIVTSVAI